MIGAQETAQATSSIPVPVMVAAIGVFGTFAVAALTAAVGRLGEATARRRQGYADAVRNLVRWQEYPYRIRRRTGDDSETLAALTAEGHAIQEDLRCSETWVTADKGWAGDLYREVRMAMSSSVGGACYEAWQSPPVRSAQEMNLNGFGPQGSEDQLRRFEKAVKLRFGMRRIMGSLPWVRNRVCSEAKEPTPDAARPVSTTGK